MNPIRLLLRFSLIIAATAALLFSTGCSSTKIARENAAGDKFQARNTRWFWKSEGIDVAFSSKPDGSVEAKAKIQSSGAEADALRDAVKDATAKLQAVK